MGARDELIELLAKEISNAAGDDEIWEMLTEHHEYWRERARGALSVIQTATSTCPHYWPDHPGLHGHPINCPGECGGQPGPLLILKVLGAEGPIADDWDEHPGRFEWWRFPRRQEGE